MKREQGCKNLVGPQLRKARLYNHPPLTQSELSRMLAEQGVSIDRIALSRIESGDRAVTDIELVALARLFDRSIEWMAFGDQKG